MNPLYWKREHQWALGVAIALGIFVGAVIAYRGVAPHLLMYTSGRGFSWGYFLSEKWRTLVGWPLFGAIVAGGVVYVRQLLRS